ncbi:MAG: hypothetical protein EBR30_10140 [Cytophagia bacterium]|nr:hypothetical protein [Cytophagia bacterium]
MNVRYKLSLCFYLFAFVIAVNSCSQISEPLRNKISFNDETSQVLDSIYIMEELLRKLPKGEVISSFVDNDGYLFVNAKKIGLMKNALTNSLIRNDSIFVNFTDKDYKRFISITTYLLRNQIGYSMKNNLSGLFVHGYRETSENTYNDVREIMIYVDTTSKNFKNYYQILDSKENMVLVAPLAVKIK